MEHIVLKNKDLQDLLSKYPDDAYVRVEQVSEYGENKRAVKNFVEISERLGGETKTLAIVIAE